MKKTHFFLMIAIFVFFSCSKEKEIQLHFLDEYVIKDSLKLKNSTVGGLSGVDYANKLYYFVIDDAKEPRFLTAEIYILKNKIDTIVFKDVVFLSDSLNSYYKDNYLDLEAIFVDEEKQLINFSSEGAINKNKKPTSFITDLKGNFISENELPENLQQLENIKHNGVLEGSSKSFDKKGFWSVMEAPLKTDGVEPTFRETQSPVRISYFDENSKKFTKQFAYQLEKITKPAKGNINLNGVTAILEYANNKFFIVERTYQSNYGSYGNIVRIFDAEITTETTNILQIDSLKKTKYVPLKKRLLLDLDSVKNQLTEKIIDNIEGITFGPVLENGNQSLLLVSDDNFQIYGKQLNQFILLEIVNK